jgi:hypothetical protein
MGRPKRREAPLQDFSSIHRNRSHQPAGGSARSGYMMGFRAVLFFLRGLRGYFLFSLA